MANLAVEDIPWAEWKGLMVSRLVNKWCIVSGTGLEWSG